MNGWFMWHPEKFPPSPSINPLFVSFHIVPRIADTMLSPKTVESLKQYEPIGARDMGTMKLLEDHGVKSYFSNCLTLTLGLKYKQPVHDGGIIFVDPICEMGGNPEKSKLLRLGRAVCLAFKHWRSVKKLLPIFSLNFNTRIGLLSKQLEKRLMCASFYDVYSKAFSDDVLFNAEYITHEMDQSLFGGDEDKMNCAKELIIKYGKAKYIITSRIHCALPCLAVETPVFFVTSDNFESGKMRTGGRLGGIIDLFHVLRYTPNGIEIKRDGLPGFKDKLDYSYSFKNKDDYMVYAEKLEEIVATFIKENVNKK